MDRKTARFFETYDDAAHRLYRARYEDFSRYLRSWLENLDTAPSILGVEIRRLRSIQDFSDVEVNVMVKPRGMVGSGRLNWSDDFETRAAGHLALLRELAFADLDPSSFAFDYFYAGDNNITRTVQEMAQHLFEPHAVELRRHLEAIADDEEDLPTVPASDRVVSLDHNSAAFREVVSSIEVVEERLRENNELLPDEKARIHLELRSGVDLLKAPRTRLETIRVMLLGSLGWLAMEFASSAVGVAAQHAWSLLKAFLAGF